MFGSSLFVLTLVTPAVVTPPISASPVGSGEIVMWFPGPVSCADGGSVDASNVVRPFNAAAFGIENGEEVELRFAIDPAGRPHGIKRANSKGGGSREDISAALAASRFPEGSKQVNCSISYIAKTSAIADAPYAEFISFAITPKAPKLPRAARQRVVEDNGCSTIPRRQPLNAAMPDYTAIPVRQGSRDWALVKFDVDEEGLPQSPTVVAGTGNEIFNTAAIDATLKWRFAKGPPKTGCTIPYQLNGNALLAPPMPDEIRSDEACDKDVRWERAPRLVFPRAYERRVIEGWAIVQYDIASWGETGNFEVLDSQPSEDFGVAAVKMLSRAKREPIENGATSCVTRILYVMNKGDGTRSDTLDREFSDEEPNDRI